MFWEKNQDGIQRTFELTVHQRTKDSWLQAVLQSARHGSQSWEIYCFVHGLPTKNPGSWLPSDDMPACRNPRCMKLAAVEWPVMWERSRGRNWQLRRAMECNVCAEERDRRCCIIAGSDRNLERYTEEPFANAPFVHPFRHPSYHAQQLRAINFAKTTQKRLLWIVAFDRPSKDVSVLPKEKQELRKERWLEFHDRFTSGIPGVFPCVLDLPVRFTQTPQGPARELGVFTNARGWLRGWRLPDEEATRLSALADAEANHETLKGFSMYLLLCLRVCGC